MRDEEHEFFADCREKKSIANSAFKRRTHNGKGGRVRFPSDNLSKKELEKMNGAVESYPLNRPVSWKEFKAWPDDIKVMYIKLLRQKFNVPGRRISEMMNVDAGMFAREIRRIGISEGAHTRSRNTPWDKDGWYAWCGGVTKIREEEVNQAVEEILKEDATEIREEMAEEVIEAIPAVEEICEEIPAQEERVWHVVEVPERKRCIPTTGNMVFEGLAEDVLETVRVLLGGAKVHISVTWDVLEEV